jgi:hypothetical protein
MNEMYQKLVDLYAGEELPLELTLELEEVAKNDPQLYRDMKSLRSTVETLRADEVLFTQETHLEILEKIYRKGGHLAAAPKPESLQYQLPMSG